MSDFNVEPEAQIPFVEVRITKLEWYKGDTYKLPNGTVIQLANHPDKIKRKVDNALQFRQQKIVVTPKPHISITVEAVGLGDEFEFTNKPIELAVIIQAKYKYKSDWALILEAAGQNPEFLRYNAYDVEEILIGKEIKVPLAGGEGNYWIDFDLWRLSQGFNRNNNNDQA